MLSQGLSIHAAANTLDAAPSTAFRWRHRFLALARDAKTGSLTGVATCYLASYLGWFRALDRSESTSTKPACLLALALGHGTRP